MDSIFKSKGGATLFKGKSAKELCAHFARRKFETDDSLELRFPLKNSNIDGLEAKFRISCVSKSDELFTLGFALAGVDEVLLCAYTDCQILINESYAAHEKIEKGDYKLELSFKNSRCTIKSLSIAGKKVADYGSLQRTFD